MCFQGESPLHTACRCGLANLTAELLQQGANPNLQTQKTLPDDTLGVALQTPLHMAISHNHPDVVSVILEQKGLYLWAQSTATSRLFGRCECSCRSRTIILVLKMESQLDGCCFIIVYLCMDVLFTGTNVPPPVRCCKL